MSDLQDIEFEINIEENFDEIIEEIELEISPIRDEDFQLTEETENTYFEMSRSDRLLENRGQIRFRPEVLRNNGVGVKKSEISETDCKKPGKVFQIIYGVTMLSILVATNDRVSKVNQSLSDDEKIKEFEIGEVYNYFGIRILAMLECGNHVKFQRFLNRIRTKKFNYFDVIKKSIEVITCLDYRRFCILHKLLHHGEGLNENGNFEMILKTRFKKSSKPEHRLEGGYFEPVYSIRNPNRRCVTPDLSRTVQVVLDDFNKTSPKYMFPCKDRGLSVDEILKSCKSFRNPLRICMRTKRDKEGIKGYLLCDNRTSFCYNLQIQLPSQHQKKNHRTIDGLVLDMLKDFYYSGVKLIGDRYYSSMPLLKNLYDLKIAYLGTAMKNRFNRFFSDEGLLTKISKNSGNFTRKLYVFFTKIPETLGKIFLFVYNDKKNKPGCIFVTNDKSLIDKNVRENIEIVDSDFTTVLENNNRPSVTNFYNENMGGVDKHDQALHDYSIARQYRGEMWYRRFLSLVKDMEFCNTFLVVKDILKSNGQDINRSDFYYQLSFDFLSMIPSDCENDPETLTIRTPTLTRKRKLSERERCKLCHMERLPKRT